MKKFFALFGGAGVGALLGILIGLSASSTVGIVIGALSSVLIVLLGLKDTADAQQHALRTGSFGFACVAAVLIGIALRTQNALAPDVTSALHKWVVVGYDPKEARQLVAFERLGIIPPNVTLDTTQKRVPAITVLFGDSSQLRGCLGIMAAG